MTSLALLCDSRCSGSQRCSGDRPASGVAGFDLVIWSLHKPTNSHSRAVYVEVSCKEGTPLSSSCFEQKFPALKLKPDAAEHLRHSNNSTLIDMALFDSQQSCLNEQLLAPRLNASFFFPQGWSVAAICLLRD